MNKGFTLLEVLVAVAILAIGIGALVALVAASLASIPISKQKFIATYLAQEGIEVVRNIRDSNWVNGYPWDAGLGIGDWGVQYDSIVLNSSYDDFLQLDLSGFYNYDFGSQTIFKRKITITSNADGDSNTEDLGIQSKVTWRIKGKNYSILLEEILYNWK